MSLTQQSLLNVETMIPPPSAKLGSFIERQLPVYLVLDKSGSIRDEMLDQLNYGITQLIPLFRKLQSTKFVGLSLSVQIITFADRAQTIYPGPVKVDDWNFTPLTSGGRTNYAAAFEELEVQLQKLGNNLTLAPVIMFFTDGYPSHEPTNALNQLLSNPIAKSAQRTGVAIGRSADRSTISQFLSEGEQIYDVANPEDLADAIVAATIASIYKSATPITGNVDVQAFGQQDDNAGTMPSIISGGFTPEEEQGLRDAGIDPNDLVV